MPTFEEAVDPLSVASQQNNALQITTIRHTVALASGCAAGALRLESLHGFGFYLVATLITSILLFILVGRPRFYFISPLKSLFIDSVIPAFPGYLLAWSLVYSLVET